MIKFNRNVNYWGNEEWIIRYPDSVRLSVENIKRIRRCFKQANGLHWYNHVIVLCGDCYE